MFPIEATSAMHVFERFPRNDRSRHNLPDVGEIRGMYNVTISPILQLFEWAAKILNDLAVHGFERTARSEDPDETGYSVDCRARSSLALTQGLLCAFLLGQIENERNPLIAPL